MSNTLTRRDSRLRALLVAAGIPFTERRYRSGMIVCRQGDPCESVMSLETGRVHLDVLSLDGNRAVCGILNAGAFLGDEALGGLALMRHTAVAMCDTELVLVARSDMVRALHVTPAVAELFLAHTVARVARLEADLADQLLHGCAQRLARTLLMLAGSHGQAPAARAVPRVSQEIIAEMIGTTRSHVNTLLATFRKRTFIESRDGTLYITPMLHHWLAAAGNGEPRDRIAA